MLVQLYNHISSRRRRQFALLLGLTILSSLAEVVSLSAVLPFIGILTQPATLFAIISISDYPIKLVVSKVLIEVKKPRPMDMAIA